MAAVIVWSSAKAPAGLAAFANAEVQIFNPMPVRTGLYSARLRFSRHQFSRVNHRMHNKLLRLMSR